MFVYKLEQEMKAPVLHWLGTLGFETWVEAPTSLGIMDVAGVQLIEERCNQRLKEGPLTPWGSEPKCSLRLLQDLPPSYPLFRRIIGIELKLSNWRRGLQQAYAYQLSCLETFVGLPLVRAITVLEKHRAEFVNLGVGLLGATPEYVRVVLPAGKNRAWTQPGRAVNLAERAWRRWRARKQAAERESRANLQEEHQPKTVVG